MKFYLICHRLPERTFKIGKWYFPVCARCTGIYMGAFLYLIVLYFHNIPYNPISIPIGLVMIFPTFIDGLTQLVGRRESNNNIRFFTGLWAGIGLALVAKSIKWAILS